MRIAPVYSLIKVPMQSLRLGLSPTAVASPLTSMPSMLPTPTLSREPYVRRLSKWASLSTKWAKLHECKGVSTAKSIKMLFPSKTLDRAAKRLSRVFWDLVGEKHVTSMGGNKYLMIVKNNFSRGTPGCTLFPTNMMGQMLSKFSLADLQVEGIPSEVIVANDGGEFNEEKIGKLYRERNMTQVFTAADNPDYSSGAEKGVVMIESAALDARTKVSKLFLGYNAPDTSPL